MKSFNDLLKSAKKASEQDEVKKYQGNVNHTSQSEKDSEDEDDDFKVVRSIKLGSSLKKDKK